MASETIKSLSIPDCMPPAWNSPLKSRHTHPTVCVTASLGDVAFSGSCRGQILAYSDPSGSALLFCFCFLFFAALPGFCMLLHAATLQAPPWTLDHVADAHLLHIQRIGSAWELKCFFGTTFSQELTSVEHLGYITHPTEIPARSGALSGLCLSLLPCSLASSCFFGSSLAHSTYNQSCQFHLQILKSACFSSPSPRPPESSPPSVSAWTSAVASSLVSVLLLLCHTVFAHSSQRALSMHERPGTSMLLYTITITNTVHFPWARHCAKPFTLIQLSHACILSAGCVPGTLPNLGIRW